jgi:hypothetical protein
MMLIAPHARPMHRHSTPGATATSIAPPRPLIRAIIRVVMPQIGVHKPHGGITSQIP